MRLEGLMIAAALAAVAGAARAEVVQATTDGFEVRSTAEIAAPADRVWAALGLVGRWWDSKHSWSGDARNLSLDLEPGGCFCEALPDGGGVRHMMVIFVQPDRQAILDGALGPLIFGGVSGHLTWRLEERHGHTTLTQTYDVGGFYPGGLDKLAPAVDGVLARQLVRLKAYVESGAP